MVTSTQAVSQTPLRTELKASQESAWFLRIPIQQHVSICMCIYICMYMYMYLYLYVYMCMCVYVCMCICVYVYMCIYVYMYICIYGYGYAYVYVYRYTSSCSGSYEVLLHHRKGVVVAAAHQGGVRKSGATCAPCSHSRARRVAHSS